LLELVQHAHEAADVLVVQRTIDFVQETERARLGEEDAEQERQCDQRALARGQEMNALRALAAGRRMNLDVAVEGGVRVLEAELALAAAEQGHEDVVEVLADLRERREEHL